jgi:serine phosphatase RsbU (regulator of sigma subunit)
MQAMEASLGSPAQVVCDRILEYLRQFQGQADQADDITLLSLVVN